MSYTRREILNEIAKRAEIKREKELAALSLMTNEELEDAFNNAPEPHSEPKPYDPIAEFCSFHGREPNGEEMMAMI